MVYTYILKDEKLCLYKIGRTTDPIKRFKDTCIRGRITPFYLVAKDRELELHKKFKKLRVTHPENIEGRTEYFKRGGVFTTTADWIDKRKELPYLSPLVLLEDLEKAGVVKYDSITIEFELESLNFGRYALALKIIDNISTREDLKNVLRIKRKVAVTEGFIKKILDGYKIRVSFTEGRKISIKGIEGLRLNIVKLNV